MISFYNQNVSYNITDEPNLKKWIQIVLKNEDKSVGDINYIFVTDESIIETNKKFLNHNYPTDIITFDTSQYTDEQKDDNIISSDIFISLDTVSYNSKLYNISFEKELRRVIIHGILHLIGYDDHCEEDIKQMRLKEEESLDIWDNLKF